MIQFQILVIIFLLRREHQLPPFPYAKIIRYGRKEAGMTTEYWIGLILALGANIAAVAAGWGSVLARLRSLEQKVDRHNCLVERVYKVEGRLDKHDAQIWDLKEREE
jgi:hypothetical protein